MKNTKKLIYILTIILIMATIIASIGFILFNQGKKIQGLSLEQQRMQAYDKVKQGEEKTNSAYVNFDAFFLQDTNGDNIAEQVRGVCKEIGGQATLYMELNVLTEGYLKNGTITINADNFYFETAIVKDKEIANNYISSNTRTIKLNQIENGTQKLITGVVKSGNYSSDSTKSAALGNDTTKYNKQNTITFTGTHVKENSDGTTTETQITKEVPFQVEWYGDLDCTIPSYINGNTKNKIQTKKLSEIIDEENNTLNMSFNIATQENQNKLILKKAYIEGTIPLLNGYEPKSVTITGNNVKYTYSDQTRKFTAYKEATLNENQVVTGEVNTGKYYNQRYTEFTLNIKYPLDAYKKAGADTVELKIPLEAYYEGYNNTSSEFTILSKSNTAKDTIVITWENPRGTVAIFEITVGKYAYYPTERYLVSKQKPLNIYNGVSEEELEDYYLVKWYGYTGISGNSTGMKMKETKDGVSTKVSDVFIKADSLEESMENLTTNVGIYFSNPENLLGENGEIKVFNDETNELIKTFTKENWNKYTESNFYKYEKKVKHIRIETSATNANSGITVYNIKELDDEYITTHYEQSEFENLIKIKSTLTGYVGGQEINTDTHSADYEAPISVASLSITPQAISTQETEKNFKITIRTECTESYNEVKWKNGAFLLKLPKEILGLEINEVKPSNKNVNIESYEQYEEDDGTKFIKIITKNETEEDYTITIDCNVTPNPKSISVNKQIELYASNENCENYYYKTTDIYDVDGDLNKNENVNYRTVTLNLVSPNSLLTSQTAKEFDKEGSIAIAPQIAAVEKDQGKAKVELNITNNYSRTISEVKILGKIPYTGNTYVLNKGQTGSQFNTQMTSPGIIIPEDLQSKGVKVYYSEQENPNNNITDGANGWTLTPNFAEVKSFLIDLSSLTLNKGDNYDFSYQIQIPTNLEYNKVSYSVHAVYFTLDTEDGKYPTQTEPSKLGFMIAKKYDLEITKYQKNNDTKKVSGATYSATEDGEKESKTRVTDENGTLTIKDLYVERTYIIKEIKSPEEYALNEEEVRFKTNVDTSGNLTVTILSNNAKSATFDKTTNTVKIAVEDEVKANLEITKIQQGTTTPLQGIQYKIEGKGLPATGKSLITDRNGKISVKGLYLNTPYTLTEIKAKGYYIPDTKIVFTITEQNGSFQINKTSGNIDSSSISINNAIPTVNLKISNEKIPTYTLKIKKVEKDKESTILPGAQFKLEGEGITTPEYYTTDSNGTITLENLYQYVANKNIEAKYTLTEIYAPEGYVISDPITFKAQIVSGKLQLQVESGTIKKQTTNGTTIEITIENEPVFKLIKQDGTTFAPLPNTKFVIYKVNEETGSTTVALDSHGNTVGIEETINGTRYNVLTTDEKGEITQDLPEGLYKAVEVETLEKYELPVDIEERSYYFGIGKSSPAKYTDYKVQWENTDKAENYRFQDVTTVSDGIIAVTFNGQVVKYDLSGNYVWENKEKSYLYEGVTTVDDGVIAVSYYGEVVKYDLSGNYIWENTEKSYRYYGVTLVPDGVIAVSYYGILVKYDIEDGHIIWENTDKSYYYNGITTVEDGVIAVGNSGKVVKYDLSGNFVWENTEKGYSYSEVTAVQDGVIAVNGTGKVVKYDLSGKVVWENKEKSYFYDAVTTVPGGVITVAEGGQVVKYNDNISNGSVEWENTDKTVHDFNDVTTVSDGVIAVGSKGQVVKYDLEGNFVWENTDKNYDYYGVTAVPDGVIAVAYNGQVVKYDFEGNYVWENTEKSDSYFYRGVTAVTDGVISVESSGAVVKYDLSGKIVWENTKKSDTYIGVTTVEDGVIVVGNSGLVVKYDKEDGHIIWENKEKSYSYYGVTAVPDGVIAVSYYYGQVVKYDFLGNIVWENTEKIDYYLEVTTVEDGVIAVGGGKVVKYDFEGNVKWENKEKRYSYSGITTVEDGVIAVSSDGEVVKYAPDLILPEIQAQQTITVKNNLKKLKITTDVKETTVVENGQTKVIRGGNILGENQNPYEEVEYGKDSKLEIKATPDTGYRVVSITVNGEEIPFKVNADKTVTLDKFINMTEDKEVIVEFSNTKTTVNVHHYEATKKADGSYTYTTNKLADDETISGTIGSSYSTKPRLDIQKYELIKETNGDLRLPTNAAGTLEETNEDVIYYYEKKEISTKVIVHHYIYDEDTKEYTKVQLAPDETKEGLVGTDYETTPSNRVPKNYKCIYETPKDYQGTMKEEIIEVTYYYKLEKTTVENSMEKTATVKVEEKDTEAEIENKEPEETTQETIQENNIETNQIVQAIQEETPTLRKEDGKISYTINYTVKVQDYIGKVKIMIVDVLPYEIDETKSNLDGGIYNRSENAIIWKIEREIDTYANGVYKETITKEIEIVYKDQDVLVDLVNRAIGEIKTYYPENHSSNPGKEQNTETAMDTSTVKQEYKVDLKVIKEWDDNDNLRERRPEDVTVTIKRLSTIQEETEENQNAQDNQVNQQTQQEPQIKKEQLAEVQLNEENNWTYEITNLPKYNEETGEKYTYEVTEKETNENDLEYYEKPEITLKETVNDLKTTYTYIVTNEYKLMDTDLNAEIKKEGTEEITSSKQQVNYTIHFTAKIDNYIGEGKVKIVDTLPYEIEEEISELDGGIYNKEKKTLTWQEELPHINTYVSGKPYLIDITKTITITYKDIDLTQEKMTNEVKGTVKLFETDEKDEKEGTFDTDINVKGKVIVRFVDKETGKDLEVLDEDDNPTGESYNYEIEEKVGKEYETEKQDIPNYNFVESTNNETGTIKEETQEVIYYYERIPSKVLVKHIDTEGNKLAEDELIEGKIWDEYETHEKQIENYYLLRIEGKTKGKMQKEQIVVIYIYDKIPTKVIVKYLEKETEKELLPDELIEGKVGDEYETQRKQIEGYKTAEPEPENNIGKMLKEPIIVIYYYEKIPRGIVKVKYVDKETNEEITTDGKEYGYDISGYVGDEYETEEEDIPYYKLEQTPENKNGTITQSEDTVIYYYRKLRFNMKIEKEISKIIVNGVEQKIKDGKIAKLEIKEKEIATTDIEIQYEIKVTNTEEIKGSAIIEENIPEGLTVSNRNPRCWTRKDKNTLETEVELEPGESETLLVVLKWEQGNKNFGDKQNRAQIKQTNNIPKYEETTKEDNQSIADIIITIQTGAKEIMMITILALTILLADTICAVYLTKYLRKK